MNLKQKALLKSLWVFHMSTGSCNNCDIEIIDCLTPRHDIERFGMVLVGSIKHADVLLVTGSVTRKCIPRIKRIYEQMPKPGFVVAMGECSLSRGMYINSYNCPLPLDKVIPVDVYVPGCPPRPEAMIAGIVKLIEKIKATSEGKK
ncbi:MAG TPA: NADH-quinone oxidoreductase subunit NuoB [Candidatus Omnitrophota bacterium]|nr:NADH-quinone oxidoreductase subunit NuoB [Candidatus Omnitrophota bacterium]HPD84899.1 NADH-quinone oxidoreductase subunit NuoB [Candidatus Omnitrophota bacterium]HRZ03757.1 NADH-quinone oxidoreductase subunit NuoB [Candidatus Omnitrophota bacterium]